MASRRSRALLVGLGVFAAVIVAVIALWDWNWFRPMAEARASAALGRQVSIRNLRVVLGWKPVVIAEGIVIANPDGSPRFAEAERLLVVLDARESWRQRVAVIPDIVIDRPVVDAVQDAAGHANWDFPALSAAPADNAPASKPPVLGNLRITDGQVHVVSARMKSDFQLAVSTQDAPDSQPANIVVEAKGTYARQPITGRLVGASLMSLRDTTQPYAIDLRAANGPTKVSLVGTVQNPLNFAGANLTLDFSGPDMELLLPLTGIPIPKTPPYQVTGKLDYADRKIRFRGFSGRVGSTDLAGDLDVDPTAPRLLVAGTIASRKVDLADLGGFIGSQPGRAGTPNQTAEQKRDVARASASAKLLPTQRFDIDKLRSTDVHIKYRAARIEGQSVPLDDMVANLDIDDGHITLTPVSFAVGGGRVSLTADLAPRGDTMHTKATVDFDRLDLSRLLGATGLVKGGGVVRGRANIDAMGSSVAEILGNGDGAFTLFTAGGDVSAVLVDLSGLQFGRAILSALGVPNRAQITCAVADFALQKGVLNTRTVLVDTPESILTGAGSINLRTETLNYAIKTDAKQLSVGSLPAPVAITGPLKDPSIRPDLTTLGVRGGAALGLGILFPPAALLPTIQMGVGDNDACATLFGRGAAPAGKPAPPGRR